MSFDKLDKNIYKHLCETASNPCLDEDDAWEMLCGADTKYSKKIDERRWYNLEEKVVEINGKFISFTDYDITGDGSASDMDLKTMWEQIYEVFPVEKMQIVYEKKEIANLIKEATDKLYSIQQEILLKGKEETTAKNELIGLLNQANLKKAEGSEIGYSFSERETATYDPKIQGLLPVSKIQYFQEFKITDTKIKDLAGRGFLDGSDLELIANCKTVKSVNPVLTKIQLKGG